ncbi:MAG: SPOR domain-containing protein [Bacteroidota bacterium]|nr:SPOR domain-containing protein [Bacteroidota bacterium]
MHYKTLLLILIGFIFFTQTSEAQVERFYIENTGFLPSWRESSHGSVLIYQDENLRKLVKKHIEVNENKFPGWRVQIYFGSGQTARHKAASIKKDFYLRYGEKYSAYIVYNSPYFKVRVGDFRTRAEAMKLRDNLKSYYKSTWVKYDIINYPEKFD